MAPFTGRIIHQLNFQCYDTLESIEYLSWELLSGPLWHGVELEFIFSELLELDRNTWNYTAVFELFVFDRNI